MIELYLAASRSPPDRPSGPVGRPCFYDAEATWLGRSYVARARYGASHALARELVAAGIPDQPVEIIHTPGNAILAYKSLHRLAIYTVSEGPATLLRSRRWTDPSLAFGGMASKAKKGGGRPSGGIPAPRDEQPPILAATP